MHKEEIREARENLRNLYTEYIKQLHAIVTQIDKTLEVVEKNGSV